MYFNKDTYSVYYEKHGTGDSTILILPGWGDTRKTFKTIIEYLKLNYTVYIIDYPGFGNSIFPDHDLTIYDYANIVREFMKKKRLSIQLSLLIPSEEELQLYYLGIIRKK